MEPLRPGMAVVKAGCAAALLLLATAVLADVTDDAKKLVRQGDYAAAEKLLLTGVEQRNVQAAYDLARLYSSGLAARASAERVVELLTVAAQQGHSDAMFLLGRTYATGEDVAQDIDAARSWLQRAADQGHPRADSALRALQRSAAAQPAPAADMKTLLTRCDVEALKQAGTLTRGSVRVDVKDLQGVLQCKDSVSLLEYLSASGIDVHMRDTQSNSLLHLASAQEQVANVRFLLRSGLSATRKNADGWSPRMLAERSDNKALKAAFGLSSQEQPRRAFDLEAAMASGRFSGWSQLSVAAWHGAGETVRELVNSGHDAAALDQTGHGPVHRAIDREHTEVAVMLLSAGGWIEAADIADLFSLNDAGLLSAVYSHPRADELISELVCMAVQEDAIDPLQRLVAARDDDRWQAVLCEEVPVLVVAAKQGATRSAQFLLRHGAFVDVTDAQRCSALCWALRRDHQELARHLADSGAGNEPDTDGMTPLMHAARVGNLAVVNRLVAAGAGVEQTSLTGSHALLLAATGGHVDVVEFLLQRGADANQKNNVGDTPLIAAVRAGHLQVSRLLLDNGASAGAHNNKRESALQLALAKDDQQWHQLVESSSGLLRMFSRDS